MHAYLKEKIASIMADAERYVAKPRHKNLRPAVISLDEQIRKIFNEMPKAQRQRSWSIYELVSLLQGRYRQHPHPQHVARELRAQGWVSSRIWAREGYGKRIWHPPISAVKMEK